MNDRVSPGHHLKEELIDLFNEFHNIPLFKMGFSDDWESEPLWKTSNE